MVNHVRVYPGLRYASSKIRLLFYASDKMVESRYILQRKINVWFQVFGSADMDTMQIFSSWLKGDSIVIWLLLTTTYVCPRLRRKDTITNTTLPYRSRKFRCPTGAA